MYNTFNGYVWALAISQESSGTEQNPSKSFPGLTDRPPSCTIPAMVFDSQDTDTLQQRPVLLAVVLAHLQVIRNPPCVYEDRFLARRRREGARDYRRQRPQDLHSRWRAIQMCQTAFHHQYMGESGSLP